MNDEVFIDRIFRVDYGRIFLYRKKSSHLKSNWEKTFLSPLCF